MSVTWIHHYNIRTTSGWAEAFDSHDIDGVITNWYVANTGHDASLTYETIAPGTVTVNTAWLDARNGNGRVSFSGGRWLVERYYVQGTLRVAANNITFRNIHQDGALGALYGVQSRLVDGNASGIIFDHCTFDGNNGSEEGATINFPASTEPDQIIFDHCDFSGYRAGIYCFAGITARYCYSHDVFFSDGSHNTGSSIRGGNCHFYRILVTDGNSSACSFYPEVGPYTNVLVEESIFRMPDPDMGAEAIFASGREFSELLEGESRIFRNNLFHRGGNLGVILDGTVATAGALPGGLGPADRNLTYLVTADGLTRSWEGTGWGTPYDGTDAAGGTGSNLGAAVDPGEEGMSEIYGNIDREGNPV